MYRIGERFPGQVFMRIGSVDDFTLHETKLYPRVEQFTKDRASWVKGFDHDDNVIKFEGMSEENKCGA